jgi:Phospholipase_D-nuclease N-terminal
VQVPLDKLGEYLPLILPLVILQLTLIVFALVDLVKPERRVRGGSKALWGVIIVLLELFGPVAYFLVGREEA